MRTQTPLTDRCVAKAQQTSQQMSAKSGISHGSSSALQSANRAHKQKWSEPFALNLLLSDESLTPFRCCFD